MKISLIFPGQGSQYIGMGSDFFEKYAASKEIFQKLDHTLNKKLSKIIFEGETNELSETQNSQPSIMATSIAILSSLFYENILNKNSYDCVAGHSLGEYSALVSNDSLEFENSLKLLKIRSRAMQESMPMGTGGMIALVGCDNPALENALATSRKFGKIYVANDNSDSQVVLSGEIKAINFVLENSKTLNIKRAIKLPVSAPFHCELMNKASAIMKNELSKYEFKTFGVPLYSNVTASICSEKEISELLVKQIVSKVKWRESVENMINDGVNLFVEIGPGSTLTNLIKRSKKNVIAVSISKLEDIDKLAKLVL